MTKISPLQLDCALTESGAILDGCGLSATAISNGPCGRALEKPLGPHIRAASEDATRRTVLDVDLR